MYQKGSGLLEFLLGLSIASVLLLASWQWQQHYRTEQRLAQMQSYIEQLLQASMRYLQQQNPPTQILTLETLRTAGVLDAQAVAHNPWATPVHIHWRAGDANVAPQLELSVSLPEDKSIEFYRQRFTAHSDAERLIWRWHPQQLMPLTHNDSPQWRWRLTPQTTQSITASPLWMLKNNLSRFQQDFSHAT